VGTCKDFSGCPKAAFLPVLRGLVNRPFWEEDETSEPEDKGLVGVDQALALSGGGVGLEPTVPCGTTDFESAVQTLTKHHTGNGLRTALRVGMGKLTLFSWKRRIAEKLIPHELWRIANYPARTYFEKI